MPLGFQMIKRYYLPMASGGQGAGEGGLILSRRFSFPKTALLAEHSLIFHFPALVHLLPFNITCATLPLVPPTLQTARAEVASSS